MTGKPKERPPAVRLFVEVPLAAGAAVPLTPGQAHYLLSVMRLRTGDAVAAFNGRDGEWRMHLDAARRGAEALTAEMPLRPQRAEPGPALLFAPVKKAGTDFMVEKATELGAAALWPVLTGRTNAARVNVERLRAHAVEAAEQCERLTVPAVRAPLPFAQVRHVWPPGRTLLVCSEHGGVPLAQAVRDGAAAGGEPPGFLVGPEGGLTGSDLDALLALPFAAAVTLGPRILRAETAALAALACWQALAGDGNAAPPPRSR